MINAVKTGLYNKLSNNSALTTELGGTHIYDRLAPQDKTRPYVIFQLTGGGHENITPSELVNLVFLVKGVADTAKAAGTVDGLVKDALHLQELSVSGYTNFTLMREETLGTMETLSDGTTVYHIGAYYRIRLDD